MQTVGRRSLSRRYIYISLSFGLFFYGPSKIPAQSSRERCYNILFIMSDQHNARAMGCYGSPDVKTPNLDKLAADGVLFERAFCQTPRCSPSRATILSGRYAHSHGLIDESIDPRKETYVSEILQEAGYVTGYIGKAHLKYSPKEYGFDHVIEHPEYRRYVKREKGLAKFTMRGQFIEDFPGGSIGSSDNSNEDHQSGYFASKAIEFLKTNKDKSFCLWLSFYGPHGPVKPSREWSDLYDPNKITLPDSFDYEPSKISERMSEHRVKFENVSESQFSEAICYYYGLISQIDHNIGRVLVELERLGLYDNTIVIYTADHGAMAGEHRCWSKGVGGMDATTGVPFIIRVPSVTVKGERNGELVGLVDIAPTLLELTDQAIPPQVEGRSIVPLLKEQNAKWRDVIFCQGGFPDSNRAFYMARTKTRKYECHEYEDNIFEAVFDLEEDPWEMHNQIDNPKYASIASELRERLEEWKSTARPITTFTPRQGINPDELSRENKKAQRLANRDARMKRMAKK